MKRRSHIDEVLGTVPTERVEERSAPTEPGLPDLRSEYGCYAEGAESPAFAVHFMAADGNVQGTFGYDELVGPGRYAPGVITLYFLGRKLFEVTIRGRGLWQLYDRLYQRRVTWVRAAPPDREFGSDEHPFVESLAVIEKEE